LNASPPTIRVIKTWMLVWAGLVAHSGSVLVYKPEEKRSLANSSCRW